MQLFKASIPDSDFACQYRVKFRVGFMILQGREARQEPAEGKASVGSRLQLHPSPRQHIRKIAT